MTVAQPVQVALVAVVVWAFFVIFGSVAISVESRALARRTGADRVVWSIGDRSRRHPRAPAGGYLPGRLRRFLRHVYAATDSVYREHFYDRIRQDLERSLYVRRVYVAVRDQS